MVPFLCLVTAAVHSALTPGPLDDPLIAIALVLQFGFNIAQPLAQRFPADIVPEIVRQYGQVRYDVTVTGPQVVNESAGPDANLLLNAQHLYPVTGVKPPPDGEVLYATRHPLQFLPYQYEGWNRRERAFLREADITIRLIDPRSID